MKHNNLLLFYVFAIVLLLGCFTIVKDPKEKSTIENRYLKKIPQLTNSDYFYKSFQNNFESALNDQFIYSDKIKKNYTKYTNISNHININKYLCRNNYTNLDSEHSLYGCDGYIVFNYSSYGNIYDKQLSDFFEGYSKLNSIKDVYYYTIDTSCVYNFNKKENTFYLEKAFKRYLKGNYKIQSFKFKDFKEYSNYFYKTDHHWNYQGSYKGYTEIMNMMGIKDIKEPIETITLDNIKYYGSNSQLTRYTKSYDIFKAYKFNLEKHDTYIDGKPNKYGNADQYIYEKRDKEKEVISLYSEYYGNDYGEIIFDYHNNKENILILSNSFDNAIDELIASHFNRTYILDFRKYNTKNFNLIKYMDDNNINKVLVIADYFYLKDNLVLKKEWLDDIQ
ncbi:MAG: hypothetical protein IIZ67_07235 [Bacilli bacterium]|nr:hypothetical protein [Bacilli bacterium]